MAISWSKSFLNKVNQSKPKTTSKPKVNSTPIIQSSSSFVSTSPVQKSAYQLQLEKIARTQAHQERTVDENLAIHTSKIKGESAGNTDNYFVNKKGESSKKASDVTSVNLEQYLKERGLETLTSNNLKAVKLTDERMASKTRESLLRKQAEIKALGGKVPDLDLRNATQVAKYNEISNVISQSKPDTSEGALNDVTSKISNFLSLDNPLTQKPKTRGMSQVGITGIEDSSVIAQGFTPNALGEAEVSKQTNEDENFVSKKGLGVAGVALGLGALGLIYFLSRRK
jgi:hypothetical protein